MRITKTVSLVLYSILAISLSTQSIAQSVEDINENKPKYYIGYDVGEMAFNKFQNFAGEIGLKFRNDHTIRFTYMNIKLTEGHLSSSFAGAVDGDNVTGLWHGYDLLYDVPIYRFKKGNNYVYGGVSVGYHENNYQHTILSESVGHKSGTIGFDIGFRETNIFKINGLYINLQIPFRYYFEKLEETELGDTTVNEAVFNQTISFFIGYEF